MYDREIEGNEYSFGVSGKLIRNGLVMYDRQTESYWSQLLGEAVDGEMVGTKLEYVTSWMTTWADWKEKYPDTLALDKQGVRGGRDSYDSYYRSGSAGVIGETIPDSRLPTKEFVAGVELAEAVIAYPYSALSATPVLNDQVGDEAVLVVFDAETAVSIAYNRAVGEQILTFSDTEEGNFTIRDAETDTLWDAFTGEAIEGALAGEQLERIKSTASFWFGWKDIHADTLLYGADEY